MDRVVDDLAVHFSAVLFAQRLDVGSGADEGSYGWMSTHAAINLSTTEYP
jgi:hypothetical protein